MSKRKWRHVFLLVAALLVTVTMRSQEPLPELEGEFLTWSELAPIPDPVGFAAPFAGIAQGALVVAGGANFPDGAPWNGGTKKWHDRIFVLPEKPSGGEPGEWLTLSTRLPRPSAYGLSIPFEFGLFALGGCDARECHSDVFLLVWDENSRTLDLFEEFSRSDGSTAPLPDLPVGLAFAGGARVGTSIYVIGGQSSMEPGAISRTELLHLDLSALARGEPLAWEVLPGPPGAPGRILPVVVGQNDGRQDALFVFSGRSVAPGGEVTLLRDAWKFTPGRSGSPAADGTWKRLPDVPTCVMAGSGVAVGSQGILLIGGDDGRHWGQDLRDAHPGFPSELHYSFHAVTESWTRAPPLPVNLVTTTAVSWDGEIVIPGGEIRPAVRSTRVPRLRVHEPTRPLGWLDGLTVVIYLGVLVAVGIGTSRAGSSTREFFLGGQRIPWWAAGLSIFGTQLSAITFMAIPAHSFRTDWVYLVANFMIFAATPLIVFIYLPFFRRLNVTTAYEYLERRFSAAVRLIASATFVLFQLGRMGIVLYLPALALSTVTELDIEISILLMGVLATFYTVMGGIEAVIWTDVLQVVVLTGGAILILLSIAGDLDGGWGEIFSTAQAAGKLDAVNWTWDITTTALWVVVIGKILEQLVPYTADQSVVQRYLTTSTQKQAARSLWTGGFLSAPASLLFFLLGTALWVFYREHPGLLNPAGHSDRILPWFVASQLPAGVAGLVIAALFAASMSSLDSSLNSCATAITTDFYRKLRPDREDRDYLRLARRLTILLGVLGTGFALYMAVLDSTSIFDVYLRLLGLTGSGLAGLFALGIFTRRASSVGALTGFATSAVVLFVVQSFTAVHFFLYAAIGILSCFAVGWLTSLAFPDDRMRASGLTLHDPAPAGEESTT